METPGVRTVTSSPLSSRRQISPRPEQDVPEWIMLPSALPISAHEAAQLEDRDAAGERLARERDSEDAIRARLDARADVWRLSRIERAEAAATTSERQARS